jgi:hypothetical protein
MSETYEREQVECPCCDGCGQVEWREDECDFGFAGTMGACTYCAGTGMVEVCANCYDDFNGCSVCCPVEGRTPAGEVTERGVAGEAEGVGRIPPDAPVGRDTAERRTDLGSRSLNVPRSVTSPVEGRGRWHDLTEDEQERVRRLLTPDPDDNLDDLAMRCDRALEILDSAVGRKPREPGQGET